jgi:hypothetical protein
MQHGSGAGHEEDSLHLPVEDTETDSHAAPVRTGTAARGNSFADSEEDSCAALGRTGTGMQGASPRRHMTACPEDDSTLASTGTREGSAHQHVAVPNSSSAESGSSVSSSGTLFPSDMSST